MGRYSVHGAYLFGPPHRYLYVTKVIQMKLRTKMFAAMAAVCMLFAVALIVALTGMKETANKFTVFLEKDQAFLSASTTLYAQGLQMGQALRNIIMDPTTPQSYKNLDDASGEFADAYRAAKSLATGDAEVLRVLDNIGQMQEQRVRIHKEVIMLAKTDMAIAIALLNKDETPVWRTIRASLLAQIAAKNSAVVVAQTQMAKETRDKQITSLVLAAAALVASAGDRFLAHQGCNAAARRRA